MKKDAINREIDKLINIRNNIWTGFLLTASGTIALLFNLDSILKWFLFIVGSLFSIILFLAYFKKDDEIERLICKLKEEK